MMIFFSITWELCTTVCIVNVLKKQREARASRLIIFHTIHLTHCRPVVVQVVTFYGGDGIFDQQLLASDDKIMSCHSLSLCFFCGVQVFLISLRTCCLFVYLSPGRPSPERGQTRQTADRRAGKTRCADFIENLR
jgi:ABC-type arginine/histidine transport system permease subunit